MSVTANTSKLQATALDFDSIKQNLITFLQSQSQFADYDFTGAAFNVLIDLLAYNTHYNAIYLNLVANEMFLDTAVLRSTVVSHAKALGYTPRSTTSPQATVNVSITPAVTDNTSILTLPRFSQFSSDSLNGTSYNYVVLDNQTVTIDGGTFNFTNVQIAEGQPVVITFQVDSQTNPNQMFPIASANIDTSTFQVIVQTSQTNTTKQTFTLATDLTTIDANASVYFLEEGANGTYQIYFGDGVIGQALQDGNILVVSYITTAGDVSNGLDGFSLQSNLLAGSTANVTTVNPSAGGSPIESVASIKFTAPKAYVAQNRAVTVNDYVALINKNYPFFDAITVWGGETETPPVYGTVFVSGKPKTGYGITVSQQQYIIEKVINPISVLTVTPVFVLPDYNYLNFAFDVDYDSNQTELTEAQVIDEITSSVENFANLNFNTFNSTFRLSRLLNSVDTADNSILGSDCSILIQKQIIPALGVSQTYQMNTGIQLLPGTPAAHLYSSPSFTINDIGGIPRRAFIEETPNSYSGLNNINIINPGTGYSSPPTLTVTGDGIGGNAYATIVNGQVNSVVIDNVGSEYTTATVTASGGGGLGAAFSVILQGQFGVLRTYYYDATNNKVILNPNAGTIDYINGIIVLNNFAPIAISNQFGQLNIYMPPAALSFSSSRNIILTLNPDDQNAVRVVMNDENE